MLSHSLLVFNYLFYLDSKNELSCINFTDMFNQLILFLVAYLVPGVLCNCENLIFLMCNFIIIFCSLNWQHQLCKNPRPNPDIKNPLCWSQLWTTKWSTPSTACKQFYGNICQISSFPSFCSSSYSKWKLKLDLHSLHFFIMRFR